VILLSFAPNLKFKIGYTISCLMERSTFLFSCLFGTSTRGKTIHFRANSTPCEVPAKSFSINTKLFVLFDEWSVVSSFRRQF
jgi:hypothetical protein